MDSRVDGLAAATDQPLARLLARATELASACASSGGQESARTADRLLRSVVRPLAEVLRSDLTSTAVDPDPVAAPLPPGRLLPDLAMAATRLRVARPELPQVAEAAAALQDMACQAAGNEAPGGADALLAELRELQAGLPPGVQVATDGPYLVTNAENLRDWLGARMDARPQMALCRCGRSALKPFCDGSHAESGFSGAKDPNRVPDRRDSHVGVQVTVLDNRGLCQHSGFCTDRLSTVFHSGAEPFVTPSGGRMDEIVHAVRNCPSGALSYAIDGHEARQHVDQPREPAIEVSKDGPYRVTGGLPLVEADATEVPRPAGASAEHYALCRCGQSQNKPFCSGMHYYVQFRDPGTAEDATPTVFEWAGGLPALLRMTKLFYAKYVPEEPLLAPLFANMSADHPERVAKWLAEVFGGPRDYSTEYGGYPRMLSQHVGKGITEDQRARWVALMRRSAAEAGLPNDAEFQAMFSSYIEWGSRLAVENSQQHSHPPEKMPMPSWGWQTAAGPPWGRVSALATPEQDDAEPPSLPEPGEPVSYAAHIKPLFRKRDRQSMQFVFDLWSYDDVCQHAEAILDRVRNGSMPCDGSWPAEQVAVFQRWVESGRPS